MGSKLVAMETKEENVFVRAKIQELHAHDDPETIVYWTGANDLEVENEWVWNYPAGKLALYTDFFPGEPNNAWEGSRDEDCVEIKDDDDDFHWNDKPCDMLDFFICEIDHAGGPLIY